jgi:hypothetical protein
VSDINSVKGESILVFACAWPVGFFFPIIRALKNISHLSQM